MQLAMGSMQSVFTISSIRRDSPGSPGTDMRGTRGFLGKQRCLHPLLTSAPDAYISHARLSLQSDNPHPVLVSRTRSATIGIPHGEFNTSKIEGTLDSEVNSTIKLFRSTNRSHSATLTYLSILV